MEANLKHIALARTDIFGVVDVETFIGQRIAEEDAKQPGKVTWDRHNSSFSSTAQCFTANQTCPKTSYVKSAAIKGILRAKQLLTISVNDKRVLPWQQLVYKCVNIFKCMYLY